MVFGGGAFRKLLDYEGGALINEISGLIKEIQESSLAPSCHVRTQRKDSCL